MQKEMLLVHVIAIRKSIRNEFLKFISDPKQRQCRSKKKVDSSCKPSDKNNRSVKIQIKSNPKRSLDSLLRGE